MANPEQYHSSPAEKIQGDFADIDLVSSAQWLQFFESQTQYKRIYDGDSNSLPDPFHEATLDYWRDRRGGNLHMTALTSFSPDSIGESARTSKRCSIRFVANACLNLTRLALCCRSGMLIFSEK